MNEPTPIVRFLWIVLIAVGASFSAGMYLAGLEALSAQISDPLTIVLVALAATYAVFLILILTNKTLRERFVVALHRSNQIFGNILQSLIGFSSVSLQIGPLTDSSAESAQLAREQCSRPSDKAANADAYKNADDKLGTDLTRPEKILESNYAQIRSASTTVTIRAFTNLLIGIAFAFAALYFLRESVALINPSSVRELSTGEVTYLVGTRVSLSVIITLIAYFFLALYKKSLEDVKYYQNELTYISGRLAGLALAISQGDKSQLALTAQALMNADRNTASPITQEEGSRVDYEKLVVAILDKLPSPK